MVGSGQSVEAACARPGRGNHVAVDIPDDGACVRHQVDGIVALGAGAAGVALTAVGSGRPGPRERRVFRRVNHSGGEQPLLRVPQQLGTPWGLPAVAVVAWATGRRRLALATALALPVEKACEVVTKKVIDRDRPAQAEVDPHLRDDAPTDGPGYPSGHAALAACAVALVTPYVGWPAAVAGSLVATATAYTRVHQGAHYPLDVLGGGLLGVALGTGLNLLAGRPR